MRLTAHALAATLAVAAVAFRSSRPADAIPPGPRHAGALALPRTFIDGMVLQRDHPIPVWGWGTPGQTVTVALGNTIANGPVDRFGAWSVRLGPLPAGGPFRFVVRQPNDSLVVADVLIGDIWIASGQSNMEFRVSQAANAEAAIAAAHDSTIREFKIPNSWSLAPDSDLAGGRWVPADKEHVGAFSAVAYFFATHLRPSVRVPIGIVNATWSGSNIETWISRGAQRITDSAWFAIQSAEANRDATVRDSLRATLGSFPSLDSGLVGGVAPWAVASLDDRTWRDIAVPAYWESQGFPGLD